MLEQADLNFGEVDFDGEFSRGSADSFNEFRHSEIFILVEKSSNFLFCVFTNFVYSNLRKIFSHQSLNFQIYSPKCLEKRLSMKNCYCSHLDEIERVKWTEKKVERGKQSIQKRVKISPILVLKRLFFCFPVKIKQNMNDLLILIFLWRHMIQPSSFRIYYTTLFSCLSSLFEVN